MSLILPHETLVWDTEHGGPNISGHVKDHIKTIDKGLRKATDEQVPYDSNVVRNIGDWTAMGSHAITQHFLQKDRKVSPHLSWTQSPGLGNRAAQFSEALKKSKLALPFTLNVYHGSGNHLGSKLMELNSGTRLLMKAPVAASINPVIAAGFADGRQYEGQSHMIHIGLPSGYDSGSYVAPYSNAPGEMEYLVHPGQKFVYGGRTTIENMPRKFHVHTLIPATGPTYIPACND